MNINTLLSSGKRNAMRTFHQILCNSMSLSVRGDRHLGGGGTDQRGTLCDDRSACHPDRTSLRLMAIYLVVTK